MSQLRVHPIRSQLREHLRLEQARSPRTQTVFQQLTQREALVLGALTDGLSAGEIARAHFVASTTVRSQIRSVLQMLGQVTARGGRARRHSSRPAAVRIDQVA